MTPDLAHAMLQGFLLAHAAPAEIIEAHEALRPQLADHLPSFSSILKQAQELANQTAHEIAASTPPDHIPDTTKMVDDTNHHGDTNKKVKVASSQHRWTNEQKQQILDLLARGEKPSDIGKQLASIIGISKAQVQAQAYSLSAGKSLPPKTEAAAPEPAADSKPRARAGNPNYGRRGNPTWLQNMQAASGTHFPPDQITTTVDEEGHTITKLPAGYAKGITPQKSVNENH